MPGNGHKTVNSMETIEVQSIRRTEAIEITERVAEIVKKSMVKEGICIIFVPHTTAAVTINENADSCVMKDLMSHLEKLVPQNASFTHLEGNSHAHIKASIIGSDRKVIIENGALKLGTWQGIFFLEFDGPRKREVFIEILGLR